MLSIAQQTGWPLAWRGTELVVLLPDGARVLTRNGAMTCDGHDLTAYAGQRHNLLHESWGDEARATARKLIDSVVWDT